MMIQNIERIEFCFGMLESWESVSALSVITLDGKNIPEDIIEAIAENYILELGGIYGQKGVGTPEQYESLKIFLQDEKVEIEFFNRAITFFTTEDEVVKRIHRVMCKIDEQKGIDESPYDMDRRKWGQSLIFD